MKVAMWYNNRDVRIEDKPVPKIGPGEVLVRVEASGICGSDVMEWYRIARAPLILGHEVSGQIVSVGEGVTRFKEGDRVALAHHVPCNTCHYCQSGHHTVCETLRSTNFDPGGFAEFVRMPAINVDRGVFVLPDQVSFEEATFVEPLACVLRGQRLAHMKPGDCVVVIGSGIAGLLHVMLAHAFGAGKVIAIDVNEYRLEAARRSGADIAVNAAENVPNLLREINHGLLADLVILCTGAPSAIAQALRSVERGGTILFFATTTPGTVTPIPLNELFWRTEITMTSSYGGSPGDYQTALALIAARTIPLEQMITHRLGLDETGLGFQLVSEGQNSLKVIIEPHSAWNHNPQA
jgi:L-iditol 2-dehydrogenase